MWATFNVRAGRIWPAGRGFPTLALVEPDQSSMVYRLSMLIKRCV